MAVPGDTGANTPAGDMAGFHRSAEVSGQINILGSGPAEGCGNTTAVGGELHPEKEKGRLWFYAREG